MNSLSLVEIDSELRNLMGWSYSPQKKCISKELNFKSFTQTFAFMTQVAMYAESQNHHPEWRNVYTKLWIDLTTHEASGVTHKDILLAAFINEKAWEAR